MRAELADYVQHESTVTRSLRKLKGNTMRTRMNPGTFRISAILGVSLVLLTVGCSHDPNVQKHKYLESGKRYAAEGKSKEAYIQFSNALKVDHNFADAHYELAKTYIKMGSLQAAYAELMRTVDLQPGNLNARIDLGNMLLAGGDPARATIQAKAVLAADPNNANGYALLASIAAAKGDRAEALAQIQHALALDPKRASFHTALGLIQASDPATAVSAEQQLRKAIALDPKNGTPHLVLASLLEKNGNLPGAEAEEKAAIAADPKNLQARASLAGLYLRQGDKAKAEDALRQGTEAQANTTAGTQLLEAYYVQTGQIDRAVAVYGDLVAKYPKSAPLKLVYARLLLSKGDIAKATTVATSLAKTDGHNPEVETLNGMLMLRNGKVNDAFNLLQKASKDAPDNVQLKLWLGRAASAKGDMTVAQESFRDAARISPA